MIGRQTSGHFFGPPGIGCGFYEVKIKKRTKIGKTDNKFKFTNSTLKQTILHFCYQTFNVHFFFGKTNYKTYKIRG